MAVKKCVLCNKSAFDITRGKSSENWLCSECRDRVDSTIELSCSTEEVVLTKNSCEKCRKRTGNCRFNETERRKITSCSDWEGKDTERNRRRWAKFE